MDIPTVAVMITITRRYLYKAGNTDSSLGLKDWNSKVISLGNSAAISIIPVSINFVFA